jgi:catechol 2,3-dioxygenase-like lactoylglutathione lyase family enzyme
MGLPNQSRQLIQREFSHRFNQSREAASARFTRSHRCTADRLLRRDAKRTPNAQFSSHAPATGINDGTGPCGYQRVEDNAFHLYLDSVNSVEHFMQLEGIDHVAMGVRDIERSAQWYIDVLGFERLHDGMWNGVPTFIGKGNTGIALFPANQEPKPSAHREIRMLHLAFRADRENFVAAQQELKKRGIEFEFQGHEIAHSIYFRDPDGHQLEITTYDVE